MNTDKKCWYVATLKDDKTYRFEKASFDKKADAIKYARNMKLLKYGPPLFVMIGQIARFPLADNKWEHQ